MVQQVYDTKKTEKGYVLLFVVIVLTGFALALAFSLNILSRSSVLTGLTIEKSNQAKALANACAEKALQEIRDNTAYSGSGGLTFDTGECSFTVIKNTGQNREIEVAGQVDEVIRNIEIFLDKINPQINIISWQEVN